MEAVALGNVRLSLPTTAIRVLSSWTSIAGACVGAIAVFIPEVAGNGYEPLNVILDQQLLASTVLMLVAAKCRNVEKPVGGMLLDSCACPDKFRVEQAMEAAILDGTRR